MRLLAHFVITHPLSAGRLLRGLTFMLHWSHAGRLTTVHVPGMDNVMAGIASRPAKAPNLFHMPSALSDSEFCSAFDTTYPLLDNQLWTLAATPPWVKFNVFKTLHGKQLALQLWTGPSVIATGKCGRPLCSLLQPLQLHTSIRNHHRQAPHICCPRAGRKVQPRSNCQGSVSQKGSPARCPKAHFGWTS
jgi:hypothetical protein